MGCKGNGKYIPRGLRVGDRCPSSSGIPSFVPGTPSNTHVCAHERFKSIQTNFFTILFQLAQIHMERIRTTGLQESTLQSRPSCAHPVEVEDGRTIRGSRQSRPVASI